MAINNPYAKYQNSAVNTSTPGELTLMLYNGCLKFIAQAKKAVEVNNIEEKNKAVQKAQAIISELMLTLDKSYPVSKICSFYMNSRIAALLMGILKTTVRTLMKRLQSLRSSAIRGNRLSRSTGKSSTRMWMRYDSTCNDSMARCD